MIMFGLLTGSYSNEEQQGIKLWKFDADEGRLEEKGGISGIERPSFIAVHPNGRSFIATSEDWDGVLVAYRLDPADNKISEINRVKSNGDHPPYVFIDEAGEWVLSVNYTAGNVNVYPLKEDGAIGDLACSVKHEGSGPEPERQDAAHPHSVFQVPGENLFLVSDLGTDLIYTYKLDLNTGELALEHTVQPQPGSGPRHLAFHPSKRIVYSLGELNSSISVLALEEGGELQPLETVSLLPDGFKGENTSAEVAVSADGKFLYASNRGHDSIASIEIKEDGTLGEPRFMETGGQGPRHFTLVPGGKWLIAANENSDSLTVLRIGESGHPETVTQTVHTNAPVCVKVAGIS